MCEKIKENVFRIEGKTYTVQETPKIKFANRHELVRKAQCEDGSFVAFRIIQDYEKPDIVEKFVLEEVSRMVAVKDEKWAPKLVTACQVGDGFLIVTDWFYDMNLKQRFDQLESLKDRLGLGRVMFKRSLECAGIFREKCKNDEVVLALEPDSLFVTGSDEVRFSDLGLANCVNKAII